MIKKTLEGRIITWGRQGRKLTLVSFVSIITVFLLAQYNLGVYHTPKMKSSVQHSADPH